MHVQVCTNFRGSLESTINFQRPDLLAAQTDPIPLNPPLWFFPCKVFLKFFCIEFNCYL